MYTILSYLKDLTCNAQFNFCFSSYYSFKPFLFFEARLRSSLLDPRRCRLGLAKGLTLQDPLTPPPFIQRNRAHQEDKENFQAPRLATGRFFSSPHPSRLPLPLQKKRGKEPQKRKLPETRLSKNKAPDRADALQSFSSLHAVHASCLCRQNLRTEYREGR